MDALGPKIRVKTTMPTLPLATPRASIETERLVLRPLSHEDLSDYHALRTQPEVVEYMSTGRADRDLDETRAVLDRVAGPGREAGTFVWGMRLAATGEFVGARTRWPSLGYYVRCEYWGRGYASEAMAAVVAAWWRLPRSPGVEMELNPSSVGRAVAAGEEVPERLFAFIASTNAGSIGVMRKLGFCKFKDWEVLDSRAGYEGQMVTLVGFLLQRPVE
ncbi:acetyltransferase [Fusarium oxysporum II5]|uniref:N-acetyltransferase domain-containing protein n=2 Tax=Fusarium oxysporum species complex TaxID=171631 RepID=X0JW12_FUSO5|nr:uncharacterized protein FOIG_07512 [Fusarium odoratissimum NRRL 54006]EXM00531.1 hypothetical protein FOIG_07512 [Fusarium odoratissimum NRRL 54006]KAK2127517.1 acetyltransferase [Fusarium oxysporum II5]TXB98415.1 hypothetical protein FocTR4_00013427 [Fusarium oxysporum f. sp. cubense]